MEKERKGNERSRRDDLRFNMLRSVLTEPLLSKVQEDPSGCFDVIISLNELYKGGLAAALEGCREHGRTSGRFDTRSCRTTSSPASPASSCCSSPTKRGSRSRRPSRRGEDPRAAPVIYRIWDDNDVHVSLTRSLTTVKADAAQRAFRARATASSGPCSIRASRGITRTSSATTARSGQSTRSPCATRSMHIDFTPDGRRTGERTRRQPLRDRLGHGTHVAGIIAGYWKAGDPNGEPVVGAEMRNEQNKDKAAAAS